MKNTKKVLAVILSLVLAVSIFGMQALAANNAVVDPAATASLTIHKYLMDDVADATVPGNGLEDDTSVPAGAVPLGGITFNVYTAIDTAAKEALPDSTGYVQVGATGYWYNSAAAATYSATTANGTGIATITPMAHAVYAVVEQFDSRVASPAAPFIVSVPMTNPVNGTEWIYNVHVYPKNSPLTIDKTVNTVKNESASVGDTLNWDITADIPSSIATAKSYTVTDVLDSKLDYGSNLVVKTFKPNVAPAEETAFVVDTDYTVTYTSATNTVLVSFTAAGYAKLATAYAADQKKISVSFDTTLNATATAGSLTNDASLYYKDASDNESTVTVATTPTVAFGGFAISKVEKGSLTPLAGAQFQLASSLENAKNGNFIKKAADGALVDFGETGYDTATAWVETTMSNGYAAFTGLKYDLTSGTDYYLSEVVAPKYDSNGDTTLDKAYNLLKDPVTVHVAAGTQTATIIDTEIDGMTPAVTHTLNNLVGITTVENSKGFTLPFTGGTGTIIFTVIGVAIMAGAVAFLVISLKKKKVTNN